MITAATPDDLNLSDTLVSIGNFDGVHLGHQMLLGHLRDLARETGRESVVITFFPPSRVLFGNGLFLSSEAEKLELLRAFEPDAVVTIPFTHEYTKTPKEVFIAQLERLRPHTIIVGEDFRFGFQRSGTLNDLSRLCERLEVFNLKHSGDAPISSSRIRDLLKAGQVEAVKPLLGRSYSARGEVMRGDRRGNTIGFPTANIQTPEAKALPLGVFAVRAEVEGQRYGGMANVGPRPSYPDGAPSLEVHLFDFAGDLYGRDMTTSFENFLRGQLKFSGLDALKAQLAEDAAAARAALAAS